MAEAQFKRLRGLNMSVVLGCLSFQRHDSTNWTHCETITLCSCGRIPAQIPLAHQAAHTIRASDGRPGDVGLTEPADVSPKANGARSTRSQAFKISTQATHSSVPEDCPSSLSGLITVALQHFAKPSQYRVRSRRFGCAMSSSPQGFSIQCQSVSPKAATGRCSSLELAAFVGRRQLPLLPLGRAAVVRRRASRGSLPQTCVTGCQAGLFPGLIVTCRINSQSRLAPPFMACAHPERLQASSTTHMLLSTQLLAEPKAVIRALAGTKRIVGGVMLCALGSR